MLKILTNWIYPPKVETAAEAMRHLFPQVKECDGKDPHTIWMRIYNRSGVKALFKTALEGRLSKLKRHCSLNIVVDKVTRVFRNWKMLVASALFVPTKKKVLTRRVVASPKDLIVSIRGRAERAFSPPIQFTFPGEFTEELIAPKYQLQGFVSPSKDGYVAVKKSKDGKWTVSGTHAMSTQEMRPLKKQAVLLRYKKC